MQQQPVKRKLGVEEFFWPWPGLAVATGVFLLGSFLYVWLRVEPVLEYHSYGPYFYWQRNFFETFLGRPGGLASYAGVFLAQFNHSSLLGALVFVLTQCLILLATLFCVVRVSSRPAAYGVLIPLFTFLLLRNRYGSPAPDVSMGFLLALAACAAHLSLPWHNPWVATAVSGPISALLFYLAGLWSALLYSILSGLFGGIRMRSWPASLSCPILALTLSLLVVAVGHFETAALLTAWTEGVDRVLAAVLYLSVPAMAAVLASLPKPALPSGASPASASPAGTVTYWSAGHRLQTARPGQALVVLLFLFGWAAVWTRFDPDQKVLAVMDYRASRGQYEAVVAAASRAALLDQAAKVRLQLALYHTGRLAKDLFTHLNRLGTMPSERIGDAWRAQSQSLFELGLINDAEHMAHEALETGANRPDVLRLLARINMLKNRPAAAQVFLNVLSRIPFQGDRGNNAWPVLDPQMLTAERACLERIRSRMLTKDVPHDSVGPLLDVLLAAQPTNRMAFEYAMAHHLINLNLPKAVERLRFLDQFDYARIPRPYEEAVLLYQQTAGVHVELKVHGISPETTARFRQFREASRRLQASAEGPAFMSAHFGDTYWFYYYANLIQEGPAEAQSSAQ